MSPSPPYLRYIFIFSPYLHRGLQSNIIPSRVPITNLYASLFSPMHEIWPTHRILLDMNTNDAGTQRQIVTFLMTEYSPILFFFPPPNFKVFYYHTVFRHFRLYSRFSVRDKFRTHTKQKQYYSHIFQTCLYECGKKTQSSESNGCKYSSNLTSYLSITPKHVHFSHFLRIYKYFFYYFLICSVDEVAQTLVSSFNSKPFFFLEKMTFLHFF